MVGTHGGHVAQPMYQQIAGDLRQQIESGVLKRGSQLPTEVDLRDRYDASRNTVRDAIKRLSSLGLIETKPGRGTFVTDKIDPFVSVLTVDVDKVGVGEGATYLSEVTAEHRTAAMSSPKVEVQPASPVIAARLRVAPGTRVVSRHQERYIDGDLWSLQTSFYPWDFIDQGASRLLMAEDIQGGAVRYLAKTTKHSQVGYRDWITARSADNNEQSLFRILHDATVFEIFRTAFDQHKRPMRVTVTVFPTDRNQFIVNVGDVPGPRYDEDLPDNS
jgi:DNA-binding GntR family transcriptional regulator